MKKVFCYFAAFTKAENIFLEFSSVLKENSGCY